MNHIEVGKLGENIGARYLVAKGFTILARNVSYACGEIDIIARKDAITYFVEVKSGSTLKSSYSPIMRVDRKKVSHLYKAISEYRRRAHHKSEWSIALLEVNFDQPTKKAEVNLIVDVT